MNQPGKQSSQDEKEEESSQPTQETNEREKVEFDSAPAKPKQVLVTDEELKSLQKEAFEYKEKYLRLLADAENARKRMQKEREEMTRYAIEGVIVDFLRPLDNLENALRFAQEMSDEVKNWAFGFQMILAQFKDTLAQHGVTAIDSLGQNFNPHDHEAIEMVESTEPPGIIVEENLKGYRMRDRTIRAARVKVAKSKGSHPLEEKNQNENV